MSLPWLQLTTLAGPAGAISPCVTPGSWGEAGENATAMGMAELELKGEPEDSGEEYQWKDAGWCLREKMPMPFHSKGS